MSNDCIEWEGKRLKNGYGVVSVKGKTTTASRFVWATANGPIPEGMFVLHRCDNPPCVNLTHLFLGTPLDNMKDMISKGRANLVHPHFGDDNVSRRIPPKGTLNGHSRLNEAQVKDIRGMADQGSSYPTIAEKFGIARSTVGDIVTRKRWNHV